MVRNFKKGLIKQLPEKNIKTSSFVDLSQKEGRSDYFDNLINHYKNINESSAKKVIKEPFPEDKSFSDSEEEKETKHDLPPELIHQDSEEESNSEESVQERYMKDASKNTKGIQSGITKQKVKESIKQEIMSEFPEDVSSSNKSNETPDKIPESSDSVNQNVLSFKALEQETMKEYLKKQNQVSKKEINYKDAILSENLEIRRGKDKHK